MNEYFPYCFPFHLDNHWNSTDGSYSGCTFRKKYYLANNAYENVDIPNLVGNP